MKTTNDIGKKHRSTYSVIFYIKKEKSKKTGLCPLMGRITIDGESKSFSLHRDADPDLWDSGAYRMTGKSRLSQEVNREIEKYTQKIDRYYYDILYEQGYITAESVKNKLDGIGEKETLLLKIFKEHNEELYLRIGVDTAVATYNVYLFAYSCLSDFLKYKYNVEDIAIHRVTLSFIKDYDFYLRNVRKMKDNSIYMQMTRLKKMLNRAAKQGTIKKNPFLEYSHGKSEMVCRYLQPDELERIMTTHISCQKLCFIRDMFVFACFTGLAYVDVFNLTEENLIRDENGKIFICTERQKSKTECRIPLMKLPLQIIEKYRPFRTDGKLFVQKSMAYFTVYFRKLEALCGIKHISFHSGRHTFATQVCLSQGVPITSISKILGHTNVKTTQIYAKVTGQKVNEDMKVLSDQIKGKYVLPEISVSDKSA